MPNSRIILTFNAVPELGDSLNVVVTTLAGNVDLFITFVNNRVVNFQSIIGATANLSAQNYSNAINLDYNNTGNYNIQSLGNQVTIEVNNPEWLINGYEGYVGVSGVIENVDPPEPTGIYTSLSASAAPCDDIVINVEPVGGVTPYTLNVYFPDDLDTSIYTDDSWGGNSTIYQAPRGANYFVRVTDDNDELVGQSVVVVPRSFMTEHWSVNVNPSGFGATVVVEQLNTINGIDGVEFSLNGVDYQADNFFSAQESGDYTLYIRDPFGCVITIPYSVNNVVEPLSSFFLIPEANSIPFAKVEEGRANYYNRLSRGEDTQIKYNAIVRFEDEVITTQFKSNYELTEVYTVDSNNVRQNLEVARVTENIGRTDRRDCVYFNAGDDKTGVYFISGNTYDYETGIQNGVYNIDDGGLPDFIEVGVSVNVDGIGSHFVSKISFSDDLDLWYAELDINYNGEPTNSICSTLYNVQTYELYEFVIAMSDYIGNNFHVVVSVGGGVVTYISEMIVVKNHWSGLDIRYFDDRNIFNINYQTGIKHIIRAYGDIAGLSPRGEIETMFTDERALMLDREVYKEFDFKAYRLSTKMAYKVFMALHHSNLVVNGVNLVLTETPEINRIGNSNWYTINAKLAEGVNLINTEQNDFIIPDVMSLD